MCEKCARIADDVMLWASYYRLISAAGHMYYTRFFPAHIDGL